MYQQEDTLQGDSGSVVRIWCRECQLGVCDELTKRYIGRELCFTKQAAALFEEQDDNTEYFWLLLINRGTGLTQQQNDRWGVPYSDHRQHRATSLTLSIIILFWEKVLQFIQNFGSILVEPLGNSFSKNKKKSVKIWGGRRTMLGQRLRRGVVRSKCWWLYFRVDISKRNYYQDHRDVCDLCVGNNTRRLRHVV